MAKSNIKSHKIVVLDRVTNAKMCNKTTKRCFVQLPRGLKIHSKKSVIKSVIRMCH
jgi:hypothetical protein